MKLLILGTETNFYKDFKSNISPSFEITEFDTAHLSDTKKIIDSIGGDSFDYILNFLPLTSDSEYLHTLIDDIMLFNFYSSLNNMNLITFFDFKPSMVESKLYKSEMNKLNDKRSVVVVHNLYTSFYNEYSLVNSTLRRITEGFYCDFDDIVPITSSLALTEFISQLLQRDVKRNLWKLCEKKIKISDIYNLSKDYLKGELYADEEFHRSFNHYINNNYDMTVMVERSDDILTKHIKEKFSFNGEGLNKKNNQFVFDTNWMQEPIEAKFAIFYSSEGVY